LSHDQSLGLVAQLLAEDDELVATEAGHRVLGSERLREPLGNGSQQLVTQGVAVAVVHDLEVIEVEEQDSRQRLVTAGTRQRHGEPIEQQRAVREVGQRIVGGCVLEPRLERLALADVAQDRGVVLDLAVGIAVGDELGVDGQRFAPLRPHHVDVATPSALDPHCRQNLVVDPIGLPWWEERSEVEVWQRSTVETEETTSRRIDVHEVAVGAADADLIFGGFEDGQQPVSVTLCLDSIGDVAQAHGEPAWQGVAAQVDADHLDPNGRAVLPQGPHHGGLLGWAARECGRQAVGCQSLVFRVHEVEDVGACDLSGDITHGGQGPGAGPLNREVVADDEKQVVALFEHRAEPFGTRFELQRAHVLVGDIAVVPQHAADGRVVEGVHAERFGDAPASVRVAESHRYLCIRSRSLEEVEPGLLDRLDVVGMDQLSHLLEELGGLQPQAVAYRRRHISGVALGIAERDDVAGQPPHQFQEGAGAVVVPEVGTHDGTCRLERVAHKALRMTLPSEVRGSSSTITSSRGAA
jgi:hypothetical protein